MIEFELCSCEHCEWYCVCQAYAVCMFAWKFIVPLIIFVVAYWKILAVLRCQTKVKQGSRQKISRTRTVDASTVAPTNSAGSTIFHVGQRENEVGSRGQRQQADSQNTGISQKEINVIKTMLYIVICFIVCWMPRTFHLLYMEVMVRQTN